jgi:mRNA-degrading endonuclease RelE of RelBE toxin-antitoxin system
LSYQIAFSQTSLAHLHLLKVNEQKIVVDEIERQLKYQPDLLTRNRKQMKPNPLAIWELRIGIFRVYYDIDKQDNIVDIRAIGIKKGNQVIIGGKPINL